MAEKEFEEQLKRSSLGKVAFIGELYDVRRESLSFLSLLKAGYPKELVTVTDYNQTEFQYGFTENYSDRFELIDVESELRLSFLFGLVTVEGSGKFLSEEKKSRKTISCSLKCQIQTKNERLFASTDDFMQHLDLRVLEDPSYTHVITEINWGANCLLNLELACDSKVNKETIKGQLAGEFSKLKAISVKGGGKLEKTDSSLLSGKDVNIKVFADVVPEGGWPTTVESFFEFVAAVPDLLSKVNDGKGKPLSYTLTPLSGIRKMAKVDVGVDFVVRKIDESFFISTVYCFEEIAKAKQKLHDFCEFLNERKQYVREEDLKRAGEMKAQLALKESRLKSLISQDWVSVRSGKKTLKELIIQMEKFRQEELQLRAYDEYLASCSSVVEKLSFVTDCTSKGILYLGIGESFCTILIAHLSYEFIVLVTSSEMQKVNPELHLKTFGYFLDLVKESKPDTQYLIIDFDIVGKEAFCQSQDSPTVTKCFHLKGAEILSRDMFQDYQDDIEGNFISPTSRSSVELCQHKPGNRVALKMTCPGFQVSKCSPDSLHWKCFSCRSPVEYGFDNFYYCTCGRSPVDASEYRCGDFKAHGNSFVRADNKFLEQELSKLSSLDEMNVLVIGQSGVGKSTWINSIINYLSYESFDKARETGVITTIPAEMTVYHPKTYQKKTFRVGDKNENEVTESGHSATQYAQTYTFFWEGRCVRIIDTPGLGDTRGIDQDKANLRNIIDHIGYLNVLHGVCILLKANDNRFNAIFTYCIKELLVNLHKNVIKNIVFCFTNSRTSLYSPGQSSNVLEKVIKGIGIEKELGLGRHNMFSLDNEAFMFLCTLQYTDIEYEDDITESFVKSWDVSSNETNRLFSTIRTFRPHLLKETLSLVKARSRVLFLTKPIAEVSKTIQMNVAVIERKKKEVKSSNLTIEELRKKLTFKMIQLEPVDLEKPRTVCSSPSCVEYITYQDTGVTEIEYRTHCHPECYLQNVTPKTINNPELTNCAAMDWSGFCTVCGCSWDKHMHLTYHQKRVEKTMENKYIKEDITKEESEKEKIEKLLNQMETEIAQYKEEQEAIIQASAKFGMFLKENAITVYNDSIAEYLEYLIQEEKQKPHKTNTDKQVIQNLNETLERYNAEVKILTEELKKNEGVEVRTPITTEDVEKLEKDLYKLELTGKQIRESVERSRCSAAAAHSYKEVPINILGSRGSLPTRKTDNKEQKGGNILSRFWRGAKSLTGLF